MTFDKDEVDSTPQAAETSAASAAPSVVNHHWTFDQAKKALSKPDATVLVLGDSTGNDEDEWVYRWAENGLGHQRFVTYHAWKKDAYAPTPERLGAGEPASLWNASQPGSTPSYHVDRWNSISKKADVVVLNFGHNGTDREETYGLSGLLEKIMKSSPNAVVVGTAQNPEKDDAGKANREAVVAWNKAHGVPTIDVNKAFADDGRGDALRRDAIHPSPAGSQVWADAVSRALGS
ncbi:SGNH/GDSL hydrolase family protein [Dermacoccus nishinomiyaensis]|uniref:SGNH/GDSL hydrolase family protein n=1 Tax=Dermacoccus nishinomiyaensis TaxID=1274 RepID=UPI00248E282C|nr:SGNH/GDSL hydrolase family protein [Dermacoccus nishinomiyaensis]